MRHRCAGRTRRGTGRTHVRRPPVWREAAARQPAGHRPSPRPSTGSRAPRPGSSAPDRRADDSRAPGDCFPEAGILAPDTHPGRRETMRRIAASSDHWVRRSAVSPTSRHERRAHGLPTRQPNRTDGGDDPHPPAAPKFLAPATHRTAKHHRRQAPGMGDEGSARAGQAGVPSRSPGTDPGVDTSPPRTICCGLSLRGGAVW